MAQTPLEFVQVQGWTYQMSDDAKTIQIAECPICHRRESGKAFGMSPKTGAWNCFHMNSHSELGVPASGNLYSLRKILGLTLDVAGKDEKLRELGFGEYNYVEYCHKELLETPHLLQIVTDEWNIDVEAVKKWKLGYNHDTDKNQEWLIIPHYVGDKLYNIKYRTWFGKQKHFQRVPNASTVFLNEEVLFTNPEYIVLCEGEKDAIVADHAGLKNVVGSTAGAGSFPERLINALQQIETIYIAYDGDEAGDEGKDKLIRRLGHNRVKVMEMPRGKDIADCVKEFGPSHILAAFNSAKTPKIQNITTLSDAMLASAVGKTSKAIPLPWTNVNRRLGGGVKNGDVVTLAAPPKTGKTSFALVWAAYWAFYLKIPVLFWCVEMTAETLSDYVTSLVTGSTRTPSKVVKAATLRHLQDQNLYFGYSGSVKPEVLIQTFRDCYTRFGIGAFFFDNIHYMVRGEKDGTSKGLAIENLMKSFKELAMELNVPIIPVAQPTLTSMRKGKDMDYTGIAWSASFASDSDTVMILYREKIADENAAYASEMLVKIDASRSAPGGTAKLKMDDTTISFTEVSYSASKARAK